MDFQLLRSLGAASYMGAAVGEVLAAVRNIQDGDPRTWPAAFAALGEQTASQGHEALQKHPVSTRDHFQRASMYYRAAEYFDDPVTSAPLAKRSRIGHCNYVRETFQTRSENEHRASGQTSERPCTRFSDDLAAILAIDAATRMRHECT